MRSLERELNTVKNTPYPLMGRASFNASIAKCSVQCDYFCEMRLYHAYPPTETRILEVVH